MGKKYLDTKESSLESSILGVWENAVSETVERAKANLDARTKEYKIHQERLAATRIRRENKKVTKEEVDLDEGTKEEYEKFFNSALKKFKIDSPADLKSDEEKKKFFNYIDKNYTGEKDENFESRLKETIGIKESFELDESTGKEIAAKMMKDKSMKAFASKVAKMKTVSRDDLEKMLPDYVAGAAITKLFEEDDVKEEVEESFEIGTNEYRDHALDVTPGETDPEWAQARDFKVASMKEALAKIWGMEEGKNPFIKKEDDDKALTKGAKSGITMTGKKAAIIDTKPKIKD